jgi:hypothetical protein
MDDDGYPEDETLERLSQWDPMDFEGLAEYLCALWHYPTYIEFDGEVLSISTGGWSGHEEIMASINSMWKTFYFYSLHRGGHYVYKKDY